MIAHREEHKVEFEEVLDDTNVHYDATIAVPLKWFMSFYASCLQTVRAELRDHYRVPQVAVFPVLLEGYPAPSHRFSALVALFRNDAAFQALTAQEQQDSADLVSQIAVHKDWACIHIRPCESAYDQAYFAQHEGWLGRLTGDGEDCMWSTWEVGQAGFVAVYPQTL